MKHENIKIEYQDTPDALRETADEVTAFLVKHLLELNAVENEVTRLAIYLQNGMHIKGMPRDANSLWAMYRKRYGEVATAFCDEKLLARGYAQSMCYNTYDPHTAGSVPKEIIFGSYAYLHTGCTLAVTVKSRKRAVIEAYFSYPWQGSVSVEQFTLRYTDHWWLLNKRQKILHADRWGKGFI